MMILIPILAFITTVIYLTGDKRYYKITLGLGLACFGYCLFRGAENAAVGWGLACAMLAILENKNE